MAKNIIICSDGTGNSTIKNRGTNVFKLFEAVDLHHQEQKQVAIYDDGVGTESIKFIRLITGAFGYGLSRNVRQLYASLARVYKPGDKIYLFGFSRGAFTVRSLAGLITKMGIVDFNNCPSDTELRKRVKLAYREYRHAHRAPLEVLLGLLFGWLIHWGNPIRGIQAFKEKYAVKNLQNPAEVSNKVHFIGVWDTVSAVGFPLLGVADAINLLIYRFKFPDYVLDKDVEHACHALSIDDQRKTFHPLLWEQKTDNDKTRIEQVWFSGVHANVGGGYPKQGMSLVALNWMMHKAAKQGIKFVSHDENLYESRQNVNDKLYDSRAGMNVYYRYSPRNIFEKYENFTVKPRIHASTINRIIQGTEGYAPGNLPRDFEIVDADEMNCQWPTVSEDMTAELGNETSLLERVKEWVLLRQASSWVFILTSLYIVYLSLPRDLCQREIWDIIGYFLSSDFFANLLKQSPWLFGVLLLCYAAGLLGRSRMQRTFSEFWHGLIKKKKFAD